MYLSPVVRHGDTITIGNQIQLLAGFGGFLHMLAGKMVEIGGRNSYYWALYPELLLQKRFGQFVMSYLVGNITQVHK